jgi:hypothetical protein
MLIIVFACGAVGTAAAEIRGVVMGPNGRPLAYATIVDHPSSRGDPAGGENGLKPQVQPESGQ